ncbi:immunoglobulin superfamily member 1-like isoform X2 [Mustelus asterias]
METGALLLLFENLPEPQISLDQPTGVYRETENVTLTCTAETHCSGKIFGIYKDGEHFNIHPDSTRDNSARFSFAALNQGGRYQCNYWCQRDGPASFLSEAVTVTIAVLNKPHFWVDSDVAAQGGDVTFNCSSPRDNPAIAFYLYRQGEMELVSVKSPAADTHSVTFTVKNIDHSKIGNYTCRYEADVNGRNLTSGDSDPVNITVRENGSVAPLVAGIGSAVGLILILALLGLCLWRKGKRGGSSEPRDTVPSVDRSSETLTYAVLNLQAKQKRDKGQRQRDIAQVEETTLYAGVKL